ncbi:MAG: divalent-cation tolerance protein CutA [Thermodesulfobacteriota bacterium]
MAVDNGGDKAGYIIAFVTAKDVEEARRIADTVIEEALVACCNIVPAVESVYRWKGKLCHDKEVLCIFKTTKALFERLKDRLVELHSYDVPEVLAFGITAGHGEYLRWIGESCGGTE